ncbi:Uncharacterised protein [Mycobacteroides abscessus subsp. abscessus]|nr:Uncharacterised protein [Mycobacteroides abscessus subsp. abscessus]SKV41019.1 Uncharacterised protein [Mycobacteroides abscessus subsp. abscessus]
MVVASVNPNGCHYLWFFNCRKAVQSLITLS